MERAVLDTENKIPEWIGAAHQAITKSDVDGGYSVVRQAALAALDRSGFPTPKSESWKYTNVTPYLRKSFAIPSHKKQDQGESLTPFYIEQISTRIVFVNGALSVVPSDLPRGVRVSSFADLIQSKDSRVDELGAEFETSRKRAFRALNGALMSQGCLIEVESGIDHGSPIHILHLTTSDASLQAFFPRVRVIAGNGSSIRIVESFIGLSGAEYLVSAATDLILGDNAAIEYTKFIEETANSLHVGDLEARLGSDARLTTHAFSFSGGTIRNEVEVSLNGTGGTASLYGLTALNNSEHVDNHLVIRHVAPHCESRELYKGVYGDQSHGVFSGTIEVSPGAQKTNAYQSNKSILLSNESRSDSMPQLKIWADDVKCSHGATVGQLDEDALFYLRSRGIPYAEAKGLMIRAFVGELIKPLAHGGVLDYVNSRLTSKLKQLGIGG